MDLNLLPLFVAVAETASFSEAARKLGLPKSSVSRGVAALESELDTQLFHRTTRHVSLTTAGTALYERSAPLIASLQKAVGSLPEREESPSGELRITAPHDLGATVLPIVISRFITRYPGIRVDARLTNRAVDLVAEGFDCAIRASGDKLADSSLLMRRLSPVEIQFYVSPLYVARKGTPRAPEDAEHHDWLLFRGWKPPAAFGPIRERAKVVSDDMLFLRELARSGIGIAMMPSFLAHADITSGRLVRALPKYSYNPGGGLVMLYPSAEHLPRKLTAFRDFLVEYLAAHPLVAKPA